MLAPQAIGYRSEILFGVSQQTFVANDTSSIV